MLTLEEKIARSERFAKLCAQAEIPEWQEECEQLAAWLRELVERRKAPEIVHCGECEHSRVWGCELYCTKWVRYTSHNGYCHRGAERRTDGA